LVDKISRVRCTFGRDQERDGLMFLVTARMSAALTRI